MNKLLVIVGPTAVGKTALGIKMAKKYDGEIVSADSRQVYKGMDIVTGKDLDKNFELRTKNPSTSLGAGLELNISNDKLDVGYRFKDGIPVWLVDIVEPDYPFNVGEYAVLAHKVINDIWKRGKLPIVVGGTGLYIKSITDQIETAIIPPNRPLRKQLEKITIEDLKSELIKIDPQKWEKMNNSDRENPRRLVRAIEVAYYYQKNKEKQFRALNPLPIDSLLMIGLKTRMILLFKKIDARVEKRLKEGATKEVKALLSRKFSWFLPALSATGCRQLREYLQGKEDLATSIKSWEFREHDYARKQMTWFKNEKRIKWFDVTGYAYGEEIEETVAKWYTSSEPRT